MYILSFEIVKIMILTPEPSPHYKKTALEPWIHDHVKPPWGQQALVSHSWKNIECESCRAEAFP